MAHRFSSRRDRFHCLSAAVGTAFAGALFITAGGAFAGEGDARFFQRVSAIPAFLNASPEVESVAEIVAAAKGGTLLVYTDALSGRIGFIDITDPASPVAGGAVPTAGSPTSVAILGDYALAAVDTSRSFVDPTGDLLVIDVNTQEVIRVIELGGQPDAVTISKDGRYAVIVIENQRDEGLGNGQPPQLPGGLLLIVDLVGGPQEWTTRQVDLAGFPTLFPEDPEPEFVDINDDNVAVVTLQENNHIAFVDLASGTVTGHFEAGAVDLEQIDVQNNGLIELTGSKPGVAREPDAIAWISNRAFATANEGDLFGGSRGFTIFGDNGTVLYDSGRDYEWAAVRVAHYPDNRSGSKGTEPEGLTYGVYDSPSGPERLLFVASERGSFIGVYRLPGECTGDLTGDGAVDGADLGILLAAWGSSSEGFGDLTGDGIVDSADLGVLLEHWGYCPVTPELVQVLPSGARPEGLLVIPERDLFVAASELDDRAGKVRSTVTIYRRGDHATYPSIMSADRADGTPMPWGALSGFIADPTEENRLYAIHDSVYRKSRIYTIDVGTAPAMITDELPITDGEGLLLAALVELKSQLPETPSFNPQAIVNADGTVNLDPEGIALGLGGGYWIASEGGGNLVDGVSNPSNQPFLSPNMLVQVDAQGAIAKVVLLPIELTRNQLRFGFEGLAAVEEEGAEVIYAAFQREWPAAGDPGQHARIGRYDTVSEEWTFAYYPLEVPTSPNGGWVGVSELVSVGQGLLATIERDDQALLDARVKTVSSYSIAGVLFAPLDGKLPVVRKTLRRDLIADGDFDAGVVLEKLEGMAVFPNGRTLVVTDNDGIGDTSGETRLMDLGILFGR